jgi:uncharacterized membrane protein HdeD (DUF308 family)
VPHGGEVRLRRRAWPCPQREPLSQAFQGSGWGAGILGVLGFLFGLVVLANPFAATIGLVWAVAFLAVAGGIVLIIAAFRFR